MVVRPQFVGPWVSWPSCLSFALQLALVLKVTVGSLLPYGLLVRLFSMYAVIPISVPFLGCVRLSGHVSRLLFFSLFSMWILNLLV